MNVLLSVPGAVPVDSILGSSYEQQISLSWREPLQTYGLIRKYEVRNNPSPRRLCYQSQRIRLLLGTRTLQVCKDLAYVECSGSTVPTLQESWVMEC